MAKARRRKATRPRRRVKRPALTNRLPRQPITSNTVRMVLPFSLELKEETSNLGTISFKDVFNYTPNKGLPFLFNQVKVHRVRVYWQGDADTGKACSTVLIVQDVGESTDLSAVYTDLVLYPGAITGRPWLPLSAQWVPTEPSERDWRLMDDASNILTYIVSNSGSEVTFKSRLSCFVSVSLRGRSTKKCKQYEHMLAHCATCIDYVPFSDDATSMATSP